MFSHLIAGWSLPHIELVQVPVFLLPVAYVGADRCFIAPRRRCEITPRPEVLSCKILPTLEVDPCRMDRAHALHLGYHLRRRVLPRDRQQHVHMVDHQMPFFKSALLLLGQVPLHFAQMRPQALIQYLAPAFRNEHHMAFALPLGAA